MEARQDQLTALYRRVFPPDAPRSKRQAEAAGALHLSDQQVYAKAAAAKNGDKFLRRWAGDASDLPSDSEGDLSLLSPLTFWTEDTAQLDRLYRASGMYRSTWERESYRQGTLAKALNRAEPYGDRRQGSAAGGNDRGQPGDLKVQEAANAPHLLGRGFLKTRHHHPDGRRLHFWREEWNVWDDARYAVIKDKELRADLWQFIKDEFDRLNIEEQKEWKPSEEQPDPPVARKVTTTLVNHVTQALSGTCVLPGRMDAPVWLGGEQPWPAEDVLAARNGLIHLPSFVANRPGGVLPPTPRFFSPHRPGL